MATTIVLKNSVTTTNTPSSLAQGEVAINVTDKKVWVGNAATTPIQIVNGGPDGVFTSVTDSGLTNTRVTYAGAGGLLKDSASITTDGTTITAAFSGAHNGTVGATTPADGKFTTLNASSTLGVGTSTLSGQLTVKAASGQGTPLNLLATDAGANVQVVFTGNRTYQVGTGNSSSGFTDVLYFYDGIAGAERMRLDSSGNLLVGGTSQSAKLTVVNSGDAISAKILVNNNFSTFVGYNLSGTPTFYVSGSGAVSKSSGTFRIEHPLPAKAPTHDLVHSFIEGPNADLIYRGKVTLVNGKANVNIDTEARMTEGTFVLLCRNIQCFTTNESDWTAIRGSVQGNILAIEAQDATSTAEISWMVIGERQDKHMYDTDWTDENGRPIIEPLKKTNIK